MPHSLLELLAALVEVGPRLLQALRVAAGGLGLLAVTLRDLAAGLGVALHQLALGPLVFRPGFFFHVGRAVGLDANTNSIAVIMKHVAGNLSSRWTDFLTADGEKPWRNRDDEFVDGFGSRAEILECWEHGWGCLHTTLNRLKAEDLEKTVLIRGEPHSVPLALERSLGHTCYHIGQIVQIARVHAGDDWNTLTIPRGGSRQFNSANWGQTGKSHS